MHDLLIVGGGLAGTILADKAVTRGMKVVWWQGAKPSASSAAYGIMNPVHIRNASLTRNAGAFYEASTDYFIRTRPSAFTREIGIRHLFTDDAESVIWRQNVESGSLFGYCSGDMQVFRPDVFIQKGAIRIDRAAHVQVPEWIEETVRALSTKITIFKEDFSHQLLETIDQVLVYKSLRFKQIIFAEGVHVLQNPFFKNLPFRPCKGEVLFVRIPDLVLTDAVHKRIFLIPAGPGYFSAGSNYEWNESSWLPSEMGAAWIIEQLQNMLKAGFKVMDHRAGIRPAMADRSPVIGEHPLKKNVYIMNGLGSRGLLQAPLLAEQLLDHMLNLSGIPNEYDVQRFRKRLVV